MISLWIPVPPETDWTRLSRRSSQSWRRASGLVFAQVKAGSI
jgi:hypothetical protein